MAEFDSVPTSPLGQDLRIFLEPGFLVAVAIVLVLSGLGIAALIYVNGVWGIPAF